MDKNYFAHQSAFVDEGAKIGEKTSVWHYSHIFSGAVIGENCKIGQNVVVHSTAVIGNNVKIQNNVSIYDGVVLEDYVFCGPSCVFTNIFNPRSEFPRMTDDFIRKTRVGRGASIGANATIVCGIDIGEYAFIGAGSVVTKNVNKYELVYGNPARQQGWVCRCGEKLDFKADEAQCKTCQRKYIKKNNLVEPVE
jgi:UDP-2-acetamido-3-amino-2,3-dideoxy-glucuronate N-acetyltransferase